MKKITLAAALLAALSSMATTAAHAEVIYYFSNAGVYNGPSVSTSDYFAKATFTDISGGVSLTMTVLNNLDSGKYVNDWAFNLASGSIITDAVSSGGIAATSRTFGNNVINNVGGAKGGDFDLGFSFTNANPGQLQNNFSQYTITGTNLTAASFNALSTGNTGGLYSAIHVQGNGISSFFEGTTGGGSGNAVPEPGTVALLGLGLFGFAAAHRRKMKSKAA